MWGYVLRFNQGPERAFYCTKQRGGFYLAVFRRQEEIAHAIAFLREGHVIPMASPVTLEAVGVPSLEDLTAIVEYCASYGPRPDGLAIALDMRADGSVARWGVAEWDHIRVTDEANGV
jgi:hypothetical protein